MVGREPSSGTKQLKNPKTGRSYDMLFLNLADHTGTRVKAQLIGKKARECAAVRKRFFFFLLSFFSSRVKDDFFFWYVM